MKKATVVGLAATSLLVVAGCMNSSKGNRTPRYPSVAQESQQLRTEQRELLNDTQRLRQERAAAGKRASRYDEQGNDEAVRRELEKQRRLEAQIRRNEEQRRRNEEDFINRRREMERQWSREIESRERRYYR